MVPPGSRTANAPCSGRWAGAYVVYKIKGDPDGEAEIDPELQKVLGTYHGDSIVYGALKMVIVSKKSYIQHWSVDEKKWLCLWHYTADKHWNVSDLAWHKLTNSENTLTKEELAAMKILFASRYPTSPSRGSSLYDITCSIA